MKLLHADATEGQLVLFTRFVLCLWLLQYLTHPFEEVAMLPLLAVDPTGVVAWLPLPALEWVFDEKVLFGGRVMILGLCLAGLSMPLFQLVGVPLCLAVTFELSLVRSFGHVGHAEVPLLLVTYVLVAFAVLEGLEDRFRPNVPRAYNRWAVPLVVSAFVFLATYSLVGVVRLTTAPLTIFTSDTMFWSILKHSSRPWLVDFDAWQWVTRWPWVMPAIQVGFPVATLFEILAPLALLSRPFRRAFVVVIVGFHVGVIVLMELPFLHHLALLALLFEKKARD